MSAPGRQRVVIVGGGFGGLAAARGLNKANVEVTVVDRINHHLFQPLLYQVAGGGVSTAECARPIRSLLRRQPNVSVTMAEVTEIDVDRREVVIDGGDRLGYDHLIFSAGMQTSYFGHDELAEHSFGLKSLQDAVDLREQVYSAFEQAERASDRGSRNSWLTFVVVGGGPTGVEVSGSLGILAHHDLKREFSRIQPDSARVILVDAGDRLVPAFSKRSSTRLANYLTKLGVELRHGCMATAIDEDGLDITAGDEQVRIDAKTVIWAAGVQAVPLAEQLARATGATTDRGGRLTVNPDLTLPDHPEIFVIGDVAHLELTAGKPVPGLATAAIQQGHHVAKTIHYGGAATHGTPFHYLDKGALAVVGRGKAVGEIRGLKLAGRLAFFTYLTVHLYYLGGGAVVRLGTLANWVSARGGRLQARQIIRPLPREKAKV